MLARNIESTFHQEATSFSDSFNEQTVREVKPIKKVTSYHKHYYPEEHSGICVVRRKGESDDELLKRFRKKFSKSGLAKELRDRMYYEKPSDKRRRKKMQSIRLLQREEEKREEAEIRYEKFKQKKAKVFAKKRRKERQDDKSSSRQDYSSVYEGDKD
jgi:small subunit ribosomal protein S21